MIVRHRGTRQVVGYSADALTTFGWCRTNGTVCRTKFLWIQTLLLLCTTAGIGYVGSLTKAFDDVHITSLYHLIMFMNGLSTFLLGLFVSLSLSRWWSLRYTCLGELWTVVAELAMLAGSYLSGTAEKKKIRHQLVRYGLLSFALVFKDARGESASEYLDDFEEKGWCTPEEAVVLRRVAIKSEAPWVWACELVARTTEQGHIPSGLRYEFHARCLRGRTAVNNVLVFVQTPLPLMYVHLIVVLVKVTSFVWSLYTGVTLAQAFDDTNPATNEHDVWPLLLLQIIVPLVYQSALELHRKLLNPFLETSAGFPEATYFSAIRKECYDIQAVFDASPPFAAVPFSTVRQKEKEVVVGVVVVESGKSKSKEQGHAECRGDVGDVGEKKSSESIRSVGQMQNKVGSMGVTLDRV